MLAKNNKNYKKMQFLIDFNTKMVKQACILLLLFSDSIFGQFNSVLKVNFFLLSHVFVTFLVLNISKSALKKF